MTKPLFEAGHFYSPVVQPTDVDSDSSLWVRREALPGIDFRPASHLQVLEEFFPRHTPRFDYPMQASEALGEGGKQGFFLGNDQYSHFDAAVLFVLMCEFKPRRVIEVGSGFSSLLMSDVARRFLPDGCAITCIEPFPKDFLQDPHYGLQLVREKVQTLPLSFFDALQAGDLLFIDSSHVAKTGSDVNFLLLEVLPRLPPGVLVHVHDVFLPQEYPRSWVVHDNRSWNEQYMLRALLTHNDRMEVVFGTEYAKVALPEQTFKALESIKPWAGSLWLRTRRGGAIR